MLEGWNITYSIGKTQILREVSVRFTSGKLSVIIGPNGSGKTTLLRVLGGELVPASGSISYDSRPLERSQLPTLARKRAFLSQHSDLSFPLTVEEVVMMGRLPALLPQAFPTRRRDLL